MTAQELIDLLGLEPHPEGGFFAETYRHRAPGGGRGAGTAIYFLLRREDRSHWHRVDGDELWHYYAGAPLQLDTWRDMPGALEESRVLGPEVSSGQRPQLLVPAGVWQAASSLGEWTLVGATVSPAFEFSGFELAPADFRPPRGRAK